MMGQNRGSYAKPGMPTGGPGPTTPMNYTGGRADPRSFPPQQPLPYGGATTNPVGGPGFTPRPMGGPIDAGGVAPPPPMAGNPGMNPMMRQRAMAGAMRRPMIGGPNPSGNRMPMPGARRY